MRTSDPASFAASTAFTYAGGQLYDYPSFYLRLADPTGASALADASGNGSTGTNPVPDNGTGASRYQVSGAPVGDGDTAVHFDGAGSYVVADSGDNSVTQDYSIELWFRTTGANGGLLAANAYPSPNANGWSRMMYVDSGGRLTYGDWTSASGYQVQWVRSASTVTDGVWHHAVGNHIGNSVTLYLDGVSQGSVWSPPQTYGSPWNLGGVNVGWGGWPNVPPSNYFTGDIDEFAYYRYGLTSTQVTTHLAATAGTTYKATILADNPALFWRLDDPPLTVTTTDLTGNHYTGTYYLTNQIIGGQPGALTTVPNNGAWFSGRQTNAYDQTLFHSPGNFTVYVWFKTSAHRGGVLYGFSASATGGSGAYDRHLWMLNDGRLAWGIYTGSTAVIESASSYNDNQWHMATTSIGAAGMKMYVDGSLVAQNSAVTSGQGFDGFWRLGGSSLGGWPDNPTCEYYTGYLDEFSLIPTQLPDSRVSQLYSVQ